MSVWQDLNSFATKSLESSLGVLSQEYNAPELGVKFDLTPHPLTFLYYSKVYETSGNKKVIDRFLNTLRLVRFSKPTLVQFEDTLYSTQEWSELVSSFQTESTFPTQLIPPDKNRIALAYKYLQQGMGMLNMASLPYYEMVNELISDVILAKVPPLSGSFGGATYFFFWGGIILNEDTTQSFTTFLEQLLHESLHMALFAICAKYGKLCTNLDTEKYSSAYRPDTRPMHGVIHAYFVAKNLKNCFSQLQGQSSVYSNRFKELLETASDASEKLSDEILKNASLTELGKSIFNTPEITNLNFLKW